MLILKYTNIVTFPLYLVILGVHVVILKIIKLKACLVL